MLVVLVVGTPSTEACGGRVEVADDSDAGSPAGSSSGVIGSSGVVGSSSSGASSSGTDSDAAGEDSGFECGSGVFDAGFDSTLGDSGGADGALSCTGSISPYGVNAACETCLSASCGPQECSCFNDPDLLPVDDAGYIDDAGIMTPGCDLYVSCIFFDLASIRMSDPDAGAALSILTSACDCSGGGTFQPYSVSLGNSLVQCMAATCAAQCMP
jgi:hypothetical protein